MIASRIRPENQRPLLRVLIGVLIFGLAGTILSVELFFTMRMWDKETTFWMVAWNQYLRAGYWAALMPLVLWLNRLVPLKSGRWVGGVSVHLGMSFMVMAAFYLGRMAWSMYAHDKQVAEGFWRWAIDGFVARNIIDMVYYWGLLAYAYTQRLAQKAKEEEVRAARLESKLTEAELSALKQQLNPHFLFNTMNTISVLVREKRNEDAVTLLARLSQLLRISIDRARVHEVTLKQELEFLEGYLEIQKVRFSDRLQLKMEVNPDVLAAKIPNLLLQPIVENAIIHGIAGKNEPGTLWIKAERRGPMLELTVKDDGVGIRQRTKRGGRVGVGLTNTRERLARQYGEHGVMAVESESSVGTTVKLSFPFYL